jgi:hypothetical protein
MRIAYFGIDDVKRPVTLLESVNDEWDQQVVSVVRPVDERAYMTMATKILAGQPKALRWVTNRAD